MGEVSFSQSRGGDSEGGGGIELSQTALAYLATDHGRDDAELQ